MIKLITSSNIQKYLPKITPGLLRAETRTNLGGFWDIESLVHSILQQEVFAFYQEGSGYSGVFFFGETPLCKTLNFFWSGKDLKCPEEIDYQEVDSFLITVAKNTGCKYISCEGRKGWKKVLTPLGYSEDSIIFTKEV